MTRAFLFPIIFGLLAVANACNVPSVCTQELRVHFTPADTSIETGQTFNASVEFSSCGGAQILTDAITWQSENPSVASVDATSGRVVGHNPGDVRITATGARYGSFTGLRVVVTTR